MYVAHVPAHRVLGGVGAVGDKSAFVYRFIRLQIQIGRELVVHTFVHNDFTMR